MLRKPRSTSNGNAPKARAEAAPDAPTNDNSPAASSDACGATRRQDQDHARSRLDKGASDRPSVVDRGGMVEWCDCDGRSGSGRCRLGLSASPSVASEPERNAPVPVDGERPESALVLPAMAAGGTHLVHLRNPLAEGLGHSDEPASQSRFVEPATTRPVGVHATAAGRGVARRSSPAPTGGGNGRVWAISRPDEDPAPTAVVVLQGRQANATRTAGKQWPDRPGLLGWNPTWDGGRTQGEGPPHG